VLQCQRIDRDRHAGLRSGGVDPSAMTARRLGIMQARASRFGVALAPAVFSVSTFHAIASDDA
jgi:hypothetical protein